MAREAQASTTTVSLVLRVPRSSNITADTQRRVRDFVRQIGYVRNQAGRELRSGTNNMRKSQPVQSRRVCFNAKHLDKSGQLANAELAAGGVQLWEGIGDEAAKLSVEAGLRDHLRLPGTSSPNCQSHFRYLPRRWLTQPHGPASNPAPAS